MQSKCKSSHGDFKTYFFHFFHFSTWCYRSGHHGSAMSSNLMKAGYRVVGYDVLAAPRRAHRRAGGEGARSCGDVAARTDIVVCSLPSPESLLATVAAIAESPRRPRVVIEASTLPLEAGASHRRTVPNGMTPNGRTRKGRS